MNAIFSDAAPKPDCPLWRNSAFHSLALAIPPDVDRCTNLQNQGGNDEIDPHHDVRRSGGLLAFVNFAAPPAQAGFCSVDNSTLERSCGFATLEQCHAWWYGKNGHCTLDPYSDDANAKLKAASNALAYQPKFSRAHKHRVGP